MSITGDGAGAISDSWPCTIDDDTNIATTKVIAVGFDTPIWAFQIKNTNFEMGYGWIGGLLLIKVQILKSPYKKDKRVSHVDNIEKFQVQGPVWSYLFAWRAGIC